MSEEEKIAEVVVDWLNAVEAACVNAKRQIGEIKGVNETAGLTWNPANISWTETEGSSGPYERSEDVDNQEFKAMLQDLAAHKGRLTRDGIFYWVFQNGSVVGRKQARWNK